LMTLTATGFLADDEWHLLARGLSLLLDDVESGSLRHHESGDSTPLQAIDEVTVIVET